MIFGKKKEKRDTLSNPSGELIQALTIPKTASGIAVDEQTALRLSTVYACIRVLAETVGTLPLVVFRRKKDGSRQKATDHYLYRILHDEPNPEMTSAQFRITMQGHLCGWGNAYAQIVRGQRSGRVQALWPLRPDRMQVKREAGRKIYIYDGRYQLTEDEVLHIAGLGFDGLVGYSPLRMAREAIGLGLATEQFGAKFFGEGTHPSVILQHPARLSDKAHENLKKSFKKAYSGLGRAHELMILEEGMKAEPLGIPPEDSQFLQTRQFQVAEICRIFRVPPHLVADLSRATFSNIEQQSLDFVIHSIRPWLVLWEQQLMKQLLSAQDKGLGYYIEHVVDGLLRGDIKSRYEAYAVARQNGWMSANDIRRLENMNPISGGDIYLIPLNMMPAPTGKTPVSEPTPTKKSMPDYRAVVAGRDRIMAAYHPLLLDAIQRAVNRECLTLKRVVNKVRGERDSTVLELKLSEVYPDIEDYLRRTTEPVLVSYLTQIYGQAQEEIGGNTKMSARADKHVKAYVDMYVAQHMSSTKGQINAIMAETEEDDLYDALDERIDEWHDTRAEKEARNEKVAGANSMAAMVFTSAGFALVWRTRGNSCAYCQALDGKRIRGGESFVPQGDFHPDGAESPLKITGIKAHPPLHRGCECYITAG